MRYAEIDTEWFKQAVRDGASDGDLAELLGVASKTITRWRQALGVQSAWARKKQGCGTHASYARGCRCEGCRAAATERTRLSIEKMRAKGLSPDDPRHGTGSAYTAWGCRCDACKRAGAKGNRARYIKMHGTARSIPNWTREEDALVRNLLPADAARRTGRSVDAIYHRRQKLGVVGNIRDLRAGGHQTLNV